MPILSGCIPSFQPSANTARFCDTRLTSSGRDHVRLIITYPQLSQLHPVPSSLTTSMAAIFARRPVLTTAAATAVAGTALYMSRPAPLRLDSAYTEPSKTLSFPRSMIFSQSLKVKAVEQVNHDTKRITFELPGGEREISGVPASCM